MVLPVLLYNLTVEETAPIFDQMGEASRELHAPFSVQLVTHDVTEAIHGIESTRGVALIMVGVSSAQEDPNFIAVRLGRKARMQNRDHYVIYVLRSRERLEQQITLCSWSSGILLLPLRENAVKNVIRPIFTDFAQLFAAQLQEDGAWVNLKVGRTVKRVRTDTICTVQAVSKAVEVHTLKETIVLNDSLENVEKLLGDAVVRCHRSFLINTNYIQYIDFKDMTICMQDGTSVPLSRSFRTVMRGFAQEKEQAPTTA